MCSGIYSAFLVFSTFGRTEGTAFSNPDATFLKEVYVVVLPSIFAVHLFVCLSVCVQVCFLSISMSYCMHFLSFS